jgi:hypothetical protein
MSASVAAGVEGTVTVRRRPQAAPEAVGRGRPGRARGYNARVGAATSKTPASGNAQMADVVIMLEIVALAAR